MSTTGTTGTTGPTTPYTEVTLILSCPSNYVAEVQGSVKYTVNLDVTSKTGNSTEFEMTTDR